MAITSNILVIGGGGSGACIDTRLESGGGGAGGYISDTAYSLTVQSYTITVGAGGAASGVAYSSGNTGNDTVAFGYTAKGGGAGSSSAGGGTGGSGGGAGTNAVGTYYGGASIGTPTQGNAGGDSYPGDYRGGGGGGAGSAGGNGSAGAAGLGGGGLSNSISGAAISYCQGGDGGNNAATIVENRGHGSHARNVYPTVTSYKGSDGVVIISVDKDYVTATGGTKTTIGNKDIWTFTSSGTFNVTSIIESGGLLSFF
jgi:hypothetical protein